MSRRCECCRQCRVVVPSRTATQHDTMPSVTRLRRLPFDVLVDAAGAYDDEGVALTSAVEFIWWLQTSANPVVEKYVAGPVLRYGDRRW